MVRKLILALLLFLPARMLAQSPTYPVYSGTVTNSLGQAVPNATVIVLTGTITGAQAVNTTIRPGSPLASICADPYCNAPINQTLNPLKSDGSGNFTFAASSGWYVLQMYGPGIYNQQITQISLGGGGAAGLTSVGMQGDGTVFNTTVTNSPVTVANQPGPLTPVLIPQPAGYALMGPQAVIPGGASISQSASGYSTDNPPLALTATFNSPVHAGNKIIVAASCVGYASDFNTSPTWTDTQGLTFTLAAHNGAQAQFISSDTSDGAESITLHTPYSSGNCQGGVINIWEVTNLTGTIDTSGYGTLFFGSGSFELSMNTTVPNQVVIISASGNGTTGVSINPPATTDTTSGVSTAWGAGGFTSTGLNGTYKTVISTGDSSLTTAFMVSYEQSGSTPVLPPTFRPIITSDLPAWVQQSFTGSSPVTENYIPKFGLGSSLTNSRLTDGVYGGANALNYSGADGIIAYSFTPYGATGTGCAPMTNGVITGNAIPGCGGGGTGNTTSTSLVTNNLPLANGANSIIDSGIAFSSSVLNVPGQIKSDATGFCIASSCITAWPTGGGGGISTFSAGDLVPLFTSTVTDPTSTPALTFALSNAAANTVFGNFTGSPAAPGFSNAPVFSAANLTSFPTLNQNTTGYAGGLAGGAVGSAPYQSGANATTFIASPTTSGHTFVFAWQPSGSAIAPTAVDADTLSVDTAATAAASDHSITACGAGEFVTGLATDWALTCASAGSSITYPPAGIPNSTGAAWATSYTTSGIGTQLALTNSPTFVTPNLGTPSTLVLTNATGAPTWNQNTTGTASNLSGTPTLPNGTAATTQASSDNSTKLATTAYVKTVVGSQIANGTITIGVVTIPANSCTAFSPVTMTNMVSTSTIDITPNSDTSGVTGWGAVGGLVFRPWPTANTANIKVCNQTGASITTSGAVTFNISGK